MPTQSAALLPSEILWYVVEEADSADLESLSLVSRDTCAMVRQQTALRRSALWVAWTQLVESLEAAVKSQSRFVDSEPHQRRDIRSEAGEVSAGLSAARAALAAARPLLLAEDLAEVGHLGLALAEQETRWAQARGSIERGPWVAGLAGYEVLAGARAHNRVRDAQVACRQATNTIRLAFECLATEIDARRGGYRLMFGRGRQSREPARPSYVLRDQPEFSVDTNRWHRWDLPSDPEEADDGMNGHV